MSLYQSLSALLSKKECVYVVYAFLADLEACDFRVSRLCIVYMPVAQAARAGREDNAATTRQKKRSLKKGFVVRPACSLRFSVIVWLKPEVIPGPQMATPRMVKAPVILRVSYRS